MQYASKPNQYGMKNKKIKHIFSKRELKAMGEANFMLSDLTQSLLEYLMIVTMFLITKLIRASTIDVFSVLHLSTFNSVCSTYCF